VTELMADATPAARKAAKEGIRNFLETTLDHVKATITDGNTDAREAMTAVKLLSSKANRQKLELVIGKENSKRVLASIDQASLALELRAMVATNSKTAPRQALQRQVENLSQPNAIASLAQGDVGLSAKKITRALTGASPELAESQKRELFAEIAKALTQRRGADAERALNMVSSAMEGQVLKDDEAAYIARLVANPLAISGDQAGREQLAR
jgi:hypothetical protein